MPIQLNWLRNPFTTEGDLPVAGADGAVTRLGIGNVGDRLRHKTGDNKPSWDVGEVFNVRDYGAVGDGVTDDTDAIQDTIDAVIASSTRGVAFFPPANYLISTALNIPTTYGWSLVGSGRNATTITQATDNVPIFNLGASALDSMHSWRIHGFNLTYTNVQSSSNTSANPIFFNSNGYEGQITDIHFQRGSYGIKVKTGVISFWGCVFDRLWFKSELSIGAISHNTGTGGIPNNCWGHFIVDADNMIGPIFDTKGYNFKIGTIEILNANQGPQLLNAAAGAEFVLDTLKCEIGTYAANKDLILLGTGGYAKIGMLTVAGTTFTVNGGVTVNAITPGSGGGLGAVHIDFLRLGAPGITGSFYAFGGASTAFRYVRRMSLSNGVVLANNGSTTTNENIVIGEYVNNRVSADKGDADYTVTLGDPNVILFQTAFTAQRTVTLPASGNDLHNGLYYDIVCNGAINGSNTLVIKAGATTLRTQVSDRTVLRYAWRRNVTAASGWQLVQLDELSGSHGVSTDNGNAAKTLTVGTDFKTQRWNTALTADRAVTLSTTNAYNGAKFHIVREASATGAFNLNVGTGPLKALGSASTWCDVEYDGSAWRLTASGSL